MGGGMYGGMFGGTFGSKLGGCGCVHWPGIAGGGSCGVGVLNDPCVTVYPPPGVGTADQRGPPSTLMASTVNGDNTGGKSSASGREPDRTADERLKL